MLPVLVELVGVGGGVVATAEVVSQLVSECEVAQCAGLAGHGDRQAGG